jgi:trehalose/maltose hydrolase-like predicted phosphorylase
MISPRQLLPRGFALCLLLIAAGTDLAHADAPGTDPSFVLSATSKNFDNYFPSYLANGYFSTMTSVRGTEGNLAYMVAFMDYAKDDIARPAAIPGWSGIDYSTGKSSVGEFWLNRSLLSDKAFGDYRQTLNMHDGTLVTSYRYTDDSKKSTRIAITTFVSQADTHIAATRIAITPEFDGTVQLSFPLNIWAPHQPRFPIGKMTGDEMLAAVAANNLSVTEPVNYRTADRAPVWYHGDTHVSNNDGSTKDLTLWLDGKAEQGLRMAEAAAIELPKNVRPGDVVLDKSTYQFAINLKIPVRRGQTYTFTKYVAMSRENWGGDAAATTKLATAARATGFDQLLAAHKAAWHELWKSDIVIDGDPKMQQAVHSDLYYLLSNSTVGTAWPMGACALTPNYAGHAFWDSDSWVFPALLLLHPERAKPIVMFRDRTMQPARDRAIQYGAKGTMYPWEADPETGVDHTPHFAYGVFREIHVNADIAIAQWQYYLASGDDAWLKQNGWPVIREIAQFWVSRVTYDKTHDRYEILHVTSPDEAYDDVPNDSFTNAAARKALDIATAAAAKVGEKPDPKWAEIAKKMYIPFDEKAQRHLDFDASVPHDKITWMGSSLAWLMYPNLDLPMTPAIRKNDFAFQLDELKVHGNDPNEMMMVMLATAAAEVGDGKTAGEWMQRNLVGFLKAPYNVRSETAYNNAGYILATSAGFVQSIVYGLTGLRVQDDGLAQTYAPVLPPGWKSLTLKRVHFRGKQYDISIDRDANGKATLTRKAL